MKNFIALSSLLLASNAFSITCSDEYGNSNLTISTSVNRGNTYYQIEGKLKNKPFKTTYMEGGEKAKKMFNDIQNGLCKPIDEDGEIMNPEANIPANVPNCTDEQMMYLGMGMWIMMAEMPDSDGVFKYKNYGFSKDKKANYPMAFFNDDQLLIIAGGCESETLVCSN